MYYFKKSLPIFLVRLVFGLVIFATLVATGLYLFYFSSQAQTDDVAYGLMFLGGLALFSSAVMLWSLYRIVADFIATPTELTGFVVAKEIVYSRRAPTKLAQQYNRGRIKGYTLRLLPPEWLQAYYDEQRDLLEPYLRNRKFLLWRDYQTLFRVPAHVYNMVLERDLVRILFGKRRRTVFGLEVLASITPPEREVPAKTDMPDVPLLSSPLNKIENAQWREID